MSRVCHRSVICLLLFACIGLGIFLRIYRHDRAMRYMDDQGELLLVAHNMRAHAFIPVIGQQITFASAHTPPLTYYLVDFLEKFGNDPVIVSSGYIIMNVIGVIGLGLFALLVFDAWIGVIVLCMASVSMTLIESARTIQDTQPTFLFVVLYLLFTETGFRKKTMWLYMTGICAYFLSVAFYPSPLLLLAFVIIRTYRHFRAWGGWLQKQCVGLTCMAVCGTGMALFVPWSLSILFLQKQMVFHVLQQATTHVSLADRIVTSFANLTVIVQDITRYTSIIPLGLRSMYWWLCIAFITALAAFSIQNKASWKRLSRSFYTSEYAFIVIGFMIPGALGMMMPSHRLLPFYPFIIVGLSYWLRLLFVRFWNISTWAGICVIVVYITGNATGWYTTTILTPRDQYPLQNKIVRILIKDSLSRKTKPTDIGIHYFTPDDQNDFYYLPSLEYLYHLATEAPLSYASYGTQLKRGMPETRALVYLVCDGYAPEYDISGCITPFRIRWPAYTPVQSYPISQVARVVVFVRQ